MGGKKYHAILTNLKNPLQYDYGFVHFPLKNPHKVRAQKMAKNCSCCAGFQRRHI